MKTFTYASLAQHELMQDIEVKEFKSMDDLINYGMERVEPDSNVVYVAMPVYTKDSELVRTAIITEKLTDIWSIVIKDQSIKGGISIFEWGSYEDACKYLMDLFDGRKLTYETN